MSESWPLVLGIFFVVANVLEAWRMALAVRLTDWRLRR